MKFVCKYESSSFDAGKIKRLSEDFCVSEDIIRILIGRGIDSKEEIDSFLFPKVENLRSPFTIPGIKKAKERIEQAIENKERILIFGDYDVDGITAVSILALYLSTRGVDVNYFIPDRENFGYGLSDKAIEFIAEKCFPDLIITVDCGITCLDEVELIKNLGIDIVVTDHHEPPEILPDCICVNTKLNCDWQYCPLCGAGTAFYLACALEGRFLNEYVDIASIATVADMVPLLGDNRIVVQMGLKILNGKNRRKCIDVLLKKCGITGGVNETTIGFNIAPRINSLGRISDATACVEFFITEDVNRMCEIAEILTQENVKRQQLTMSHLDIAINAVISERLYNKRFISVCDKAFSNGINGLVASQLVSQYYRPAFVFSTSGDILTGSVRSIPGVDVVDVLTSQKELLVKFGGHSMAGGVTLKKENYDGFLKGVEKYLNKIPDEIFDQKIEYDIDFSDKKITVDDVEQIEKLAPFGIANARPVFLGSIKAVNAGLMKKDSAHVKFKCGDVCFIYFNGEESLESLNSELEKQLVFDLKINDYNNVKSVTATVKAHKVIADTVGDEKNYKYLRSLVCDSDKIISHFLSAEEFSYELKECLTSDYSTAVLINTNYGFEFLKNRILERQAYSKLDFCVGYTDKNNNNTIVFQPENQLDLSLFDNVFIVEKPLNGRLDKSFKFSKNAAVYACDYIPDKFLDALSLEREVYIKYYRLFSSNPKLLASGDFGDVFYGLRKLDKCIRREQCYLCFLTFLELKIFVKDFKSGVMSVDRTIKVDLTTSKAYNGIKEAKFKHGTGIFGKN